MGRHALAWLRERVSSDGDDEGYQFGSTEDLVLYDFETGTKRVVDHGAFHSSGSYPGFFYPNGRPTFFDTRSKTIGSTLLITYLHCTTFSGLRVRKSKQAPLAAAGLLGDGEGAMPDDADFSRGPKQLDSLPQDAPGTFRVGMRGGGSFPVDAVYWTYRGHRVRIPLGGECTWDSRDHSKKWFLLGQYASSAGSDKWIYEIDWKKEQCSLVADDVLNIDFDPATRYWAASSNNKQTASPGKIRVWSRDLWVGDRITRKQWRIASGAVHGDSLSVQPE